MKKEVEHLYRSIFATDDTTYLKDVGLTFNRDGLKLSKRLLCAISVATTIGRPRHLRFYIEWALIETVPVEEVREVILQSYLFAGYPAAIEGFFVLRDVLVSRGLVMKGEDPDFRADEWKDRGMALCRRVYGKNYDRLRHHMKEISPELDEWMIVEGYGKVLSRPQLDPAVRELCTVAALTAQGRPRQLLSHIKGALNVGASETEVREAITQTGLFVDSSLIEEALKLLP
jgi:4-carboxymuconolactone decarboxylase